MRRILGLIVPAVLFMSYTSCRSMQVSEHELKAIVEYLASDEINGRDTGSEGIEKAATYVENYFKKSGIPPFYDSYRDEFKVEEIEAFNVIGVIEGSDPKLKDEYIIIGAHYDHIGNKAKIIDGDKIANGANDNASGTATAMVIGKYFAKTRSNKRSIIIALFSAEEVGLKGSTHLADRLKSQHIDLYAMLNFEMTGVPFKDRAYEALLTGYDKSNMAEKINEYVGDTFVGRSEVSVKYDLFKRSDNYPFYEVFKVPCQTISSCDLSNFDYYHHVDDEADKIDYAHMSGITNTIIPAIETIANSETKEIKLNGE